MIVRQTFKNNFRRNLYVFYTFSKCSLYVWCVFYVGQSLVYLCECLATFSNCDEFERARQIRKILIVLQNLTFSNLILTHSVI